MSLQREIELQPGETVQLAFLTLAADSRAKLLDVAGRYQSWPAIEHAIGQARSRAELELRQSSLSTVELERIQTLLSALLYPQPGLRAAAGHAGSQHPRPARLVGLRHLGRLSDPAGAHRRRKKAWASFKNCCRRTLTGANAG